MNYSWIIPAAAPFLMIWLIIWVVWGVVRDSEKGVNYFQKQSSINNSPIPSKIFTSKQRISFVVIGLLIVLLSVLLFYFNSSTTNSLVANSGEIQNYTAGILVVGIFFVLYGIIGKKFFWH